MRLVGAGLLVAGLLGVGAPGVAVACACGGIVSPDVGAQIADEEELVALDGDRETVVMRLTARCSPAWLNSRRRGSRLAGTSRSVRA